MVSLTTESGVQVPVHVTDNKDKTYKVEFNPTTVGTLSAVVSYANQPVPKSPFKVSVQPAVDVSKVHVKELPASKFQQHNIISHVFWKIVFQLNFFTIGKNRSLD